MYEINWLLNSGRKRKAMTIVELLVVIGVMGILAALTTGAVILYMGTQRANNTKTFLGKINTRLNNQYQAAIQEAKKPIPAAYVTTITGLAGGDSHTADRAKVIWTKASLKQKFPMSFAEVLNPAPLPSLPPLPAYVTYLNSHGITTGNNPPLLFESSACLLMALQRSDSGGGTTAEDIGAGGASRDFPVGTGTIKALVDGWGNPLQFCRWPSGSPQINPTGAQTGFNDQQDTQGVLNVPSWLTASGGFSPNAQTFQNNFHPLVLPNPGPMSYRLTPLVASAGPDGIMALDLYTMTSQNASANDNLYSTGN